MNNIIIINIIVFDMDSLSIQHEHMISEMSEKFID